MRGVVTVAACLLAGCFNPAYDKPKCGPGDTCPEGLTCSGRTCVSFRPSNGATFDDLDGVVEDVPFVVPNGFIYKVDTQLGAIGQGAEDANIRPSGEGYNASAKAAFSIADRIVPVLSVDTLHIEAGARLLGSGHRPLVVLARGEVSISGVLDFSARCSDPTAPTTCAGPGGADGATGMANPGCGDGSGGKNSGSGGGGGALSDALAGNGGGSTAGPGGDRGDTHDCETAFTGGFGGGRGGDAAAFGGGGGGAIQITSFERIRLQSADPAQACGIDVGGGGGVGTPNGGGGGGSGGRILLEAPEIVIDEGCFLTANGGGGGSGRNPMRGNDGTTTHNQAPGGGGSPDGAGGAGGAAAGDAANGEDGGGGGGGSVGFVELRSDRLMHTGAVLSPAPRIGEPLTR